MELVHVDIIGYNIISDGAQSDNAASTTGTSLFLAGRVFQHLAKINFLTHLRCHVLCKLSYGLQIMRDFVLET